MLFGHMLNFVEDGSERLWTLVVKLHSVLAFPILGHNRSLFEAQKKQCHTHHFLLLLVHSICKSREQLCFCVLRTSVQLQCSCVSVDGPEVTFYYELDVQVKVCLQIQFGLLSSRPLFGEVLVQGRQSNDQPGVND